MTPADALMVAFIIAAPLATGAAAVSLHVAGKVAQRIGAPFWLEVALILAIGLLCLAAFSVTLDLAFWIYGLWR